jgi:hypothetical protein
MGAERCKAGYFGVRLPGVTVAPTDPLVGRARELERFRTLVGASAGGSATTLLIEGEAGIGKTRLLTNLIYTRLLTNLIYTERECGVTVFVGEAHRLERTRPIGVLVDALDLRRRSSDPRRAALERLLAGGPVYRISRKRTEPD